MFSSFSLGSSIQLSVQVSECLSLDFTLLPFIQSCLQRHQSGDFGQVFGPDLEACVGAYDTGGRVCSVYEFSQASRFSGIELSVVTPSAGDTTIVSFLGELF